jgi:hypothetical protein
VIEIPIPAPLKLSGTLPWFVSVTSFDPPSMPIGVLGNVRLLGERVTTDPVPVPLRVTVCGVLAAVSEMVRVAVAVPGPIGRKLTEIMHSMPSARTEGHVLEVTNQEALVPVRPMLLIERVSRPVFFKVTV